MQIKPSQKKRIQADMRIGVILLITVCFVFAMRILTVPISVGTTILTMILFAILIAGYFLPANPTLIQVAREQVLQQPKTLFIVPIALYVLYLIYALLVARLVWLDLIVGALYCTVPLTLVWLLRNRTPSLTLIDAAVILLLWFPVEFGWLPKLSLPPVQGVADVFHLNGIILFLVAYLVIRGLPDVGFTWRLKGPDVRTAIQNTIFFMPTALIIGFATGFLALSRRLPSGSEMFGMFVGIYFFIALPEELLFRGIIQNLIEKKLAGRNHHIWIALGITSIIFGLSHGNNPDAPLLDINLGVLGVWHCPWVYLILATIAGWFYGYTYIKTRKVTAAAIVHLMVDWIWAVFLSG